MKKALQDITDRNYQQKGYSKYVIDYRVEGSGQERTRAFDKTKRGAVRQVTGLYPGLKVTIVNIYQC